MRILVCGSRTWDVAQVIWTILGGYLEDYYDITIVQGDCPTGADREAKDWALNWESSGVKLESYPADWVTYGKSAGHIRNQRMLTQGKPDVVLAFVDKPLEESRGTFDMVQRAGKARVPVYVVRRYN